MKKMPTKITLLFPLLVVLGNAPVFGQFAGPVGSVGSTAIYKDSAVFLNWANTCTVTRGPMDISAAGSGFASTGTEVDAIGVADGSSVVSLGDGGSAVLTFPFPIMNAAGPDFAVFENSFSDQFLELAFVEVSSDGVNYVRFPATSFMQDTVQLGPFSTQGDASKLNNLAGKYRGSHGTPFDLQELDGTSGLDIMHITHVKLIDVVGSIDPLYATYDQFGTAITDPFPTAFASGGFDLDAVGVIHQNTTSGLSSIAQIPATFRLTPNPASTHITVRDTQNTIESIAVYSAQGTLLLHSLETTISLTAIPPGVYVVHVHTREGVVTDRFVKN